MYQMGTSVYRESIAKSVLFIWQWYTEKNAGLI